MKYVYIIPLAVVIVVGIILLVTLLHKPSKWACTPAGCIENNNGKYTSLPDCKKECTATFFYDPNAKKCSSEYRDSYKVYDTQDECELKNYHYSCGLEGCARDDQAASSFKECSDSCTLYNVYDESKKECAAEHVDPATTKTFSSQSECESSNYKYKCDYYKGCQRDEAGIVGGCAPYRCALATVYDKEQKVCGNRFVDATTYPVFYKSQSECEHSNYGYECQAQGCARKDGGDSWDTCSQTCAPKT